MARRMFARLGLLIGVGVPVGWLATPALADWKLNSTSRASVAYNQGMTFDQAHGNFFFDGVSSTSNSAVYRTTSALSRTASNTAVIPTDPQANPQGYNHAGDLSFDPVNVSITDTGKTRVLLPLECYYPDRTPSNTCGSGAFGVVDPTTLSFLYYVKLWTPQIQKAMWDEITPDGHWIFTSAGTHLLAYNAADINKQRADYQLQGVWGGLGGKDLGAVLATSNVSGAAFYVVSGVPRLFLALNLGTSFQVVSYGIGAASDGTPVLLSSTPTVETSLNQSSSNNEPEGLAVTDLVNGSYPLGSVLHWQMLPSIKLSSRILNYAASSGASSGSSLAARCTVPNLKNHTLKQARNLLGAAHCSLGTVRAKQTSRTRRGKVIAQHPKPGARLAARSRVSVVVGIHLARRLVAEQPTLSGDQESRKRRADR
jgi:PASTA domain